MEKAALVGRLFGLFASLSSGEGESERQGASAQGRGETDRPMDEGHCTFLLLIAKPRLLAVILFAVAT